MRKDPHEGAAKCVDAILAQFGERLDREDIGLLEQVGEKLQAKIGTERRRREALENRITHNAVGADRLPEWCVFEVTRRGVEYKVNHNVRTGLTEFVSSASGLIRSFRLAPLEAMVTRAAIVDIDRSEAKSPRRKEAEVLASGVVDVSGCAVEWHRVSDVEVAFKIPAMKIMDGVEPGGGIWMKDSVPGDWTFEERVYEAASRAISARKEAVEGSG